ncbi:MAG: SAM-dependent methyltransferase [Roseibacillus sp.]
MELALYDHGHGYYHSGVAIGRRGDFATSATLSDTLGRALAAWILEHEPAHLIEVGAGTGQLARAILQPLGGHALRRWGLPNPFRRGLTYHIVERSPRLQAEQRKLLGRSVRWHRTLEDALEAAGGSATIFSNELVDAFPVRVFRRDDQWQELHLVLEDGQITEDWRSCHRLPVSTLFEESWPAGQRLEVHESYRQWLAAWLPRWNSGQLLTIDYGGAPTEIYHRAPAGSLRAYSHHERLVGLELYTLPGRRDLTADVNFDDLVSWSEALGIETVSLATQRGFLLPHLAPNDLSAADRFLTDPDGAGTAFKVLLQKRSRGALPEREFQPQSSSVSRTPHPVYFPTCSEHSPPPSSSSSRSTHPPSNCPAVPRRSWWA